MSKRPIMVELEKEVFSAIEEIKKSSIPEIKKLLSKAIFEVPFKEGSHKVDDEFEIYFSAYLRLLAKEDE